MSQEETSCYRKRPPITVRNLLSQEETSCFMKKHLEIDIQMEHNADEQIEIAENVPSLQNAYKIFKNDMNLYWIIIINNFHSLNSTSTQVESDKVISWTTTPPPHSQIPKSIYTCTALLTNICNNFI
jgi:hypothetical protein